MERIRAQLDRPPSQRVAQEQHERELDQLQGLEATEVDPGVLGELGAAAEEGEGHEHRHHQRGQHRVQGTGQGHRVPRQHQDDRGRPPGERDAFGELRPRPQRAVHRIAVAHLQGEADRQRRACSGKDDGGGDVDHAPAGADQPAEDEGGDAGGEEQARPLRVRVDLLHGTHFGGADRGGLGEDVLDAGLAAQPSESTHRRHEEQLEEKGHATLSRPLGDDAGKGPRPPGARRPRSRCRGRPARARV